VRAREASVLRRASSDAFTLRNSRRAGADQGRRGGVGSDAIGGWITRSFGQPLVSSYFCGPNRRLGEPLATTQQVLGVLVHGVALESVAPWLLPQVDLAALEEGDVLGVKRFLVRLGEDPHVGAHRGAQQR
jgi:hypothetical protein